MCNVKDNITVNRFFFIYVYGINFCIAALLQLFGCVVHLDYLSVFFSAFMFSRSQVAVAWLGYKHFSCMFFYYP